MKASLAICLLLIGCVACAPSIFADNTSSDGGSKIFSINQINTILNGSGDDDSRASQIESAFNDAVGSGSDIGSAAEQLFKLACNGGDGSDVVIKAIISLCRGGSSNIIRVFLNAAASTTGQGSSLPSSLVNGLTDVPGFSQLPQLTGTGGSSGVIADTLRTAARGVGLTARQAVDSVSRFAQGDIQGGARGVANTAKDGISTAAGTANTFISGSSGGAGGFF